jgi:integrase
MALRVSYGGGKSFVYFYRAGGRLRRMTLGTYPAMTLAGAREAWRKAREEAQAGRDPAKAKARPIPSTDFESIARDWLKRDRGKTTPRKDRSARELQRIVERELVPAWGHRPIADLGRRDILDLIDGIADRGAIIMARRVQAVVHRLLKWSVARGVIEINHAAGLPKPGHEVRRDRVLTDAELTTLWKAATDLGWPYGDAIKLLILTGARRDEIGSLQWHEIDLPNAKIRLEGMRTKSGAPHLIPLSGPAIQILECVPRIAGCEFVFTMNSKRSVTGWANAKDKLDQRCCGFGTPWRIHDLRRSVATGLQKLGVTLRVIEAVLGHVSGSRAGVVGIYQRHSFDAEKAAALEAWGAHVTALIEGREPAKVLPMRGRQP